MAFATAIMASFARLHARRDRETRYNPQRTDLGGPFAAPYPSADAWTVVGVPVSHYPAVPANAHSYPAQTGYTSKPYDTGYSSSKPYGVVYSAKKPQPDDSSKPSATEYSGNHPSEAEYTSTPYAAHTPGKMVYQPGIAPLDDAVQQPKRKCWLGWAAGARAEVKAARADMKAAKRELRQEARWLRHHARRTGCRNCR